MDKEKVERELRDLMNLYHERYEKLQREYKEAKESGNVEDQMTSECLQRQCRIMTAQLFKTMKSLGVLDEEEMEYGGIKNK